MAEPGKTNGLHAAIRQTQARREAERRASPDAVMRPLALLSALGWILVMPALAGLFLGRWFDGGDGVAWTAGLLLLGISIGAYAAWKRMIRA